MCAQIFRGTAMPAGFIHLRIHSEYSLYDSTIRIKDLIKRTAEFGMPALALTDQSNMYAYVKFYNACLNAGIKPILGVDLWIENPEDIYAPFRMTALCQNEVGYKALREIISQAYSENQHHGRPLVKKEWLFEKSDGLILLSGAKDGDIGQRILNGKPEQAESVLEEYLTHFPERFYLEVQRTGHQLSLIHI